MMRDLKYHLGLAVAIDRFTAEACTDEVMTVPAVDDGEVRVMAPGKLRLVEDLVLGRRTFTTIHFLMNETHRAESSAHDFTESAAVLLRRLMELTAQVFWLTGIEPPEGLELPIEPALPAGLDDLLAASSEVETDRRATRLTLASVTEWIDVQALRAVRSDIRQSLNIGDAFVASAESDIERQATYNVLLDELRAMDRLLVAYLETLGTPVSRRMSYTDLFSKMGHAHALAYRYESDVSHANTAGRQHQRGGDGQPMLGNPSTPARRQMVMHVANAFMLELAERALTRLGADVHGVHDLAASAAMQANAE